MTIEAYYCWNNGLDGRNDDGWWPAKRYRRKQKNATYKRIATKKKRKRKTIVLSFLFRETHLFRKNDLIEHGWSTDNNTSVFNSKYNKWRAVYSDFFSIPEAIFFLFYLTRWWKRIWLIYRVTVNCKLEICCSQKIPNNSYRISHFLLEIVSNFRHRFSTGNII